MKILTFLHSLRSVSFLPVEFPVLTSRLYREVTAAPSANRHIERAVLEKARLRTNVYLLVDMGKHPGGIDVSAKE